MPTILGGDIVRQIEIAQMLISLGITTFEKVKALWKDQGLDDERLDTALKDLDARIARRS